MQPIIYERQWRFESLLGRTYFTMPYLLYSLISIDTSAIIILYSTVIEYLNYLCILSSDSPQVVEGRINQNDRQIIQDKNTLSALRPII